MAVRAVDSALVAESSVRQLSARLAAAVAELAADATEEPQREVGSGGGDAMHGSSTAPTARTARGDILDQFGDFLELTTEVGIIQDLKRARDRGDGGAMSGVEAELVYELREAKRLAREEREQWSRPAIKADKGWFWFGA